MSESSEKSEEKLPISEVYKVIDYVTIFKSEKWWEAIVLYESYGKRSVGVYLWVKKNDTWKRKNKFSVRNLQEWSKIKDAVDKLAPKLAAK
ncbi:MAG: hypothetical protein N3E52_05435 [Candidatus Bathyarchaeota archaeon]|nr:hypothetical protein [Candidatus Bathyarchaeota archaeon]